MRFSLLTWNNFSDQSAIAVAEDRMDLPHSWLALKLREKGRFTLAGVTLGCQSGVKNTKTIVDSWSKNEGNHCADLA